jgi:ribonuclease J
MVMVVMAVSKASGDILYGPDVVTRGVVSENASDTILEDARIAVLSSWEEAGPETRKDPAEMKTDIRRALRRFFGKRLDRRPMVIPVLLEL